MGALRASSHATTAVLAHRLAREHLRSGAMAMPSSRHMATGGLRQGKLTPLRNIEKLMCCNRGEIAIRVFRAGHELGLRTVGVYADADRHSLHRYKCDESYMIDGENLTPVGSYLAYDKIVQIAKLHGVDAIHPGYGLLSENSTFARRCEEEGIRFVGPPSGILRLFGDKTEARKLAIAADVPVVPGSDGPVSSLQAAKDFVQGPGGIGFPIIIKAAHGGGGRGMRIVRRESEFAEAVEMAQTEAYKAFGDGTIFIERYVDRPRHIEIQIFADKSGEVVHLFERDCSVQRRHQKVVEIAPASGISLALREKLWADAVRLTKASGYMNAGTVEFLVDQSGRHYFIEVNPRVQVEHTVTEEITGVDIVQTQIKIADGYTLAELGIRQENLEPRGHAIQCRVTTENPRNNFAPDYGRIDAFRPGEGMGIRLDSAAGFAGAVITPHFDSLLIKATAHAESFHFAAEKLVRALAEFRVRGVHTNIPFLRKVLTHPVFLEQKMATDFIDVHPELFHFPPQKDRANKLMRYLAEVRVNGHPMPGPDPIKNPSRLKPVMPIFDAMTRPAPGWKQVLEKEGPSGFAKKVREFPYTLVGDTTWRDAHQSLLATRMRTIDMAMIAPATARASAGMYALENWGGATFDVSLRFLRECPWRRLETLRELVPNIPFQCLLRGANAVGYTSYPDNVVFEFCKEAVATGMDVFRVFDSLNYADNLLVGMEAVHKAGGVVQGEMCYTGDVMTSSKYNLDYYMRLAEKIVKQGETHVLGIKDMAGLLKPAGAELLIGALRKEYPNVPIHVHTHDTGGIGVSSMLAAAKAGADVVHGALDSMSGTTSQPSLGAIVSSLNQIEGRSDAPIDVGGVPILPLNVSKLTELSDYWDTMRGHYAPFEQGARSSSADVFVHEMPGGQYTNLMFQSQSLGLAKQWKDVKAAYAQANKVLGDIVKVTPSSKVVGDLAQFMVTNKLTGDDIVQRVEELNLPKSVVDFLQGQLGQPEGGFPEPLRTQVLMRANLEPIEGRPGAELTPYDFVSAHKNLEDKYRNLLLQHGIKLVHRDVISAALYPQVFDEYMRFREKYSDEIGYLPTEAFLAPMTIGEEYHFPIEEGKTLITKLISVSPELDNKGYRDVFFELNGVPRLVKVLDVKAGAQTGTGAVRTAAAERANPAVPGQVGASMPGTVVEVKVKPGVVVRKGEQLLMLSAMKMETIVSAPVNGTVKRVLVELGDLVQNEDLLVEIEE
ncbi:Pyruvate carboxylase 1 [Porphyridium purpureum]|uniref:pyruvate carboxylase n=1 Tax=Porphyridium purpureum TaxID=35688 RepID=A0A5J4YKE6_PORPP|nr:Pyruvate carboxylase 1 [Porphyridium purpureum]|eukprot:POR2339..scf244_11